MEINSFPYDGSYETTPQTKPSSINSKAGLISSHQMIKINCAEGAVARTRFGKLKNNNISPYLSEDIHLISHLTEKTLLHKKAPKFTSSFPLAVSLYKASSDEFKTLHKKNKKVKKSVLTLPNNPTPRPQTCTVSDLNDCEYLNPNEDFSKTKKRAVVRHTKNRRKSNNFDFYDRDAHYCSQLNIDLDCSSTEIISNMGRRGKKSAVGKVTEENVDSHNVWTVLRNINRFQFRPSPPMTDESSNFSPRKKKCQRRRNNRKDMRVVETCCTEEFAYISSIEVDNGTLGSQSQTSSFDRITVIDREHSLGNNMCKQIEKATIKGKQLSKLGNKNRNSLNKPSKKNNVTTVSKSINGQYQNKKLRSIKPGGDVIENCYNPAHLVSPSFVTPAVVNKTEIMDNSTNISNDNFGTNTDLVTSYSSSNKLEPPHIAVNQSNLAMYNLVKNSSNDSGIQVKGITKVIVNNGKKLNDSTPYSTTPVPPKVKSASPVTPKLTRFDIQRRVSKLNFPIVILGKDQLSSSYEVINPNFTQFKGLGDQIWPFMIQWNDLEQTKEDETVTTKDEIDISSPKLIQAFETGQIKKPLPPKEKKYNKELKYNFKNRLPKSLPLPNEEQNDKLSSEKNKPICLFKDKMLRLLYKSSHQNLHDGKAVRKVDSIEKKQSVKVDVSTNTKVNSVAPRTSRIFSPVKVRNNPILPHERLRKPKSKWASDLIENVIKKIKSGVYYTIDNNTKKPSAAHFKEIETQTIVTKQDLMKKNDPMQSISKIVIKKKYDPFVMIPGFDNDNMLPKFEIKSMTLDEISIKTSNNKILVHFDINVPNDPLINTSKNTSLIPVDISDSHTKIFKCKTIIKNSMLPAEICSILPKLICSLTDTNDRLSLSSPQIEKSVIQLSTIKETSSIEVTNYVCSNSSIFSNYMSPELKRMLSGHYQNSRRNNRAIRCRFVMSVNYTYSACDLLPNLNRSHLFNVNVKSIESIYMQKIMNDAISQCGLVKTPNTCTALQVYPMSERRIVPVQKSFNFWSMLQNFRNISLSKTFNNIELPILTKPVTINVFVTDWQGLQTNIIVNINKLDETSLENIRNIPNILNNNMVTYKNGYSIQNKITEVIDAPTVKTTSVPQTKFKVNKRYKKYVFVKHHKTSKSCKTPKENKHMPISKITNLDDFFVVLGTVKLSGVFDSYSGHKILSCIGEMKKWTSQISPRQALLVLLLMNKKDTPNLLLFRSVLLQGIAMNRITRSIELDMEIEVIEKEYVNKVSKYEGISYLPASLENQDVLLEELIWIAKNTASDYQIPFDESSENLLKSLVKKRKQLNPSYLRVMARYVGLGLLKLPKK